MHNQQHTKPLQHVAIIMDGNGRWAEAQGKERLFGHQGGVESIRHAVKGAIAHGVRYLTLYAFSTENWGRPQQEVDSLMELLCKCAVNEVPVFIEYGVRIRFIGDRSPLSDQVKQAIDHSIEQTAKGERLDLIVALNYSSRDEIVRATRKIAQRVADKELAPQDIDQQTICESLDTAEVPDPDLIIRTSGEIRLSNFLLWQAAYSEFYFTTVLWPDFTEQTFAEAVEHYNKRERRYGQLTTK